MRSVDTLPKTTFSGRRFTRKQLAEIQETVQLFRNLSRSELAFTVCEHLDWKTPKGSLKIKSCLSMLEALEAQGVISLPAKEGPRTRVRRTPAFVEQPETSPIEGSLSSVAPVQGTRQGKIVLVQLMDSVDPETNQRYTVKRYRSEKTVTEDSWKHEKIILEPLNPAYEPLTFTANPEEKLKVIAELVEVLG